MAIEIDTGEVHVFHAKAVSSPPAGSAKSSSTPTPPHRRRRRHPPARACRWRTWSFFSSTRPAHGTASCSPRRRAARAGSAQRQGRALHGALRPHHEGPRAPRHGRPLHLTGSRRGPGHRPQTTTFYWTCTHLGAEGPRPSCPISPRSRVYWASTPYRAGAGQPTAHYAMGGIPTDNDGQVLAPTRALPACMRPASAPASRYTARTGSAPTRWSTWWCSAARRCNAMRVRQGHAEFAPLPADPGRNEVRELRDDIRQPTVTGGGTRQCARRCRKRWTAM